MSLAMIGRPSVIGHLSTFSKILSETAWPIKLKFYVEPPWVGGTKVCSRDFSLDPMPFKLILKWFFSEIMWPIKMIFYVEPFRKVALIFCSLCNGIVSLVEYVGATY